MHAVVFIVAALVAFGQSAEVSVNVSGYLTKGQENLDRPWVLCSAPTDGDNIYKYSIAHLNSSQGIIDFAQFKNKTLLLVNVATFCQSPIEYPVYNQLKEKFGDKIEIVGFPSNQFWNV